MKYLPYLTIIALAAACSSPQPPAEEPVATEQTEAEVLLAQAHETFGPLPAEATNENNPHSGEKVALGRALFFDTRLSKDGNISCNSCHNLATFGVDNLKTSPGDDGTMGERNSPTVLNAAFHGSQFWDGRAKDVEEQAGGPILNAVEMAIPSAQVLEERLAALPGYQQMFTAAFPEEESPIRYENIQMAIGAFERRLITPAPFDAYVQGEAGALDAQQQRGLQTFIEIGCPTCHHGPTFGGQDYQKFGLMGNYWEETGSEHADEGRYKVTQDEADRYVFKVPSLRNVAMTHPYFHDGSVDDLGRAVEIMAKLQLGQELTAQQTGDIVAFLESLTGELPAELTGTPALPE